MTQVASLAQRGEIQQAARHRVPVVDVRRGQHDAAAGCRVEQLHGRTSPPRAAVAGRGDEAEQAQSNEDLVRTRTILPATTTIERLCADALVDAERRIEARIAERVSPGLRHDLERLLKETADAGVTRLAGVRSKHPRHVFCQAGQGRSGT